MGVPSISEPTAQHAVNDNDAYPRGWLGSLLSIANNAILAPQLALASPRPTAPPHPLSVSHILLGRQSPQTCGYINADISSPATCSAGFTCASNTINSVHYCCSDAQSCTIPTTCLNSAAVPASCGPSCLSDPFTLKCTFTDVPFCYSRFWNETPPLSGFGCAPSPFTQTVYTTYQLKEVETVTAFASASSTTKSASATNVGSITQSSSSVAASFNPSLSSQNSQAASTNAAGNNTTGGSLETSSTALSHGAIAGIAVGGFFGVVLLLGLGGLIYKKCLQPSRPSPPKNDRLDPAKPQVIGDDSIIHGLGDIRPADSISLYHFRSDSSTVVSPPVTNQGSVPMVFSF